MGTKFKKPKVFLSDIVYSLFLSTKLKKIKILYIKVLVVALGKMPHYISDENLYLCSM